MVVADMAAAVEAVNTVAPEHLGELHWDAMGLLGGIRNAGAIFVGRLSSEPLGRLRCRPQSHTADRRYGHVLQPAFGGGVR